ncbi:MAG: phosphoribosylformylglycinamidine cyclo-ligase [bacterium]
MPEQKPITYRDAGVDIDAGERAVEMMKKHVRSTFNSSVLAELGSFGAMFALDLSGMKTPVLVSSADGVGTKLKIAFAADRHNTVGQCLVNHCVNDILVQGARALFFLDYYACGKLDPLVASAVVEGLSIACRENGCALIGGETAEMPDMYTIGEYDMAGFIVGMVDKEKVLTGENIKPGDMVIGLQSNGLHTNGYSLARRLVFDVAGLRVNDIFPWGVSVADELLRVHKSYANSIHPLLEKNLINGMAHITGGGLIGNLVRSLPTGCRAYLDSASWQHQPVFTWLCEQGKLPLVEQHRTFNMGIGFTVVCASDKYVEVMTRLKAAGETAWLIGEIKAGEKGVEVK